MGAAVRALTYAERRCLDWDEIGRWAGWRKGKPARRPDTEVCAAFGVNATTVRRRRARVGALRCGGTRTSWSDADYRAVMGMLRMLGRTPAALLGEHHRRMKFWPPIRRGWVGPKGR